MSLHNPRAGVDLVSVEEVAESIDRFGDRYLTRVYTATERREAGGRAERLAGRFAAKEAVFKALGPAGETLVWTDIEIRSLEGGPPGIRLRGRAARWAESCGIGGWAVSITHDQRTAAAIVVARPAVQTGSLCR